MRIGLMQVIAQIGGTREGFEPSTSSGESPTNRCVTDAWIAQNLYDPVKRLNTAVMASAIRSPLHLPHPTDHKAQFRLLHRGPAAEGIVTAAALLVANGREDVSERALHALIIKCGFQETAKARR